MHLASNSTAEVDQEESLEFKQNQSRETKRMLYWYVNAFTYMTYFLQF